MQFEMACPSCPLCKRQLPASAVGFTLDTRLCEPCRALVLTAFRGRDATDFTALEVVPQNPVLATVEYDSAAFEYAFAGSPSSSAKLAAARPGLEPKAEHPKPFEALDGLSFSFFEDEQPNHRIGADEEVSSAVAETDSSQIGEMPSNGFARSIDAAAPCPDPKNTEFVAAHLANEPAFIGPTSDSESIEAHVVVDPAEAEPSIGEQAVTDPWAAPLPAWECSQSEWPVLVGSSERRSLVTPRRALALAIILLAVTAGLCFLLLRTSTPLRRTDVRTGAIEGGSAAVEPHSPAGEPENSDAPGGESSSTAAPGAPSTPTDAAFHEVASSSEDNNGRGRFSLQAAAFPSQSGADEFAEKLKRAGVPSYVAPVDLARRGKWFRVRVGRFNGAEDAQKFVGEAQQRARAAGLSLQLIVCQYDQP